MIHDTSLSRVADRVEASLDAQALAAQHRATLEWVPHLTDFPCTVFEAKQLLRQVSENERSAGMLGRNGIGPHVEHVLRAARYHGFGWRERSAQA